MPFKSYLQQEQNDCGPTCLRMVIYHYRLNFSIQTLRTLCDIDRDGVSLNAISEAAQLIGLEATGVRLNANELKDVKLPCILHWRRDHFVVLYKIKSDRYYLSDPAVGKITLKKSDFNKKWLSEETGEGLALLLNLTPKVHETKSEQSISINWTSLFKYFITYKKLFIQLVLGLVVGTMMQLIVPFLTQSIVDIGIQTKNLNFVTIILIAQLVLIIGRVSVEFLRSWILLHVSTRINMSILTDFLIKLMKLPVSFFETKNTGDILERITDQRVIESFLTGSALRTAFSLFNLLIFGFVLVCYNTPIFIVFGLSSVIYVFWIVAFLRYRRTLNYKNFTVSSENQSSIVELVNGIKDIKVNNCERQKRWEWENLQVNLFKLNAQNMALAQYQQGGSTFINEGTNLLITFLSARAVINGHLTLGAMMAVQYMIGQLSNPVQQFLGFIQGYQDAKLSVERLNEIHLLKDEEPEGRELSNALPPDKSINLRQVSFKYPGSGGRTILNNINLQITQGETTALVGMSGSGKTSIIKLLLRFYEPQSGDITVGDEMLNSISFKTWRGQCGVVLQDGFIFSDTIERNISVTDDVTDMDKLTAAIRIANIHDFIDALPAGVKTKIGAGGKGVSQGQRQRLLIARAVYKNPQYLFLDEATNALDSINERIIIENLQHFFKGRTVVIVAHRLSTISNADKIVLFKNGCILEQGTHTDLIAQHGEYYELNKNQLELNTSLNHD